MLHRVLYVASFEERPSLWLNHLIGLQRLGLQRLDITGMVAPGSFWEALPQPVAARVFERLQGGAVPQLRQLAAEVRSAGFSSTVLQLHEPGEAALLRMAREHEYDMVVVPMSRDGVSPSDAFLADDPKVPVAFLGDGVDLSFAGPVLVPWSEAGECGRAVDFLERLVGGLPTVHLCGLAAPRGPLEHEQLLALRERLRAQAVVRLLWARHDPAEAVVRRANAYACSFVAMSYPRSAEDGGRCRALVTDLARRCGRPTIMIPAVAAA